MTRFPKIYAVGALCGLVLIVIGLFDVNSFVTDLMAGRTTTGDPSNPTEVVERAKDAGRYWVLMAAWLRHLVFGVIALTFCGWAWRNRVR